MAKWIYPFGRILQAKSFIFLYQVCQIYFGLTY